MANRQFTNQQYTMEKAVVSVFAKVTFGSSGAPTLVTANSKAVKSIARNSAGDYTVTFGGPQGVDTYYKLLQINHRFVNTTAPASPSMWLKADSTSSAGTCEVVFNSAGTATDPASGEAVLLEFVFGNSSAF